MSKSPRSLLDLKNNKKLVEKMDPLLSSRDRTSLVENSRNYRRGSCCSFTLHLPPSLSSRSEARMVGLNKRRRLSSSDEEAVDLILKTRIDGGIKRAKQSIKEISRTKTTSKRSSKSGIFSLPTELLNIIFEHCEQRDLLALCSTSKPFYLVAAPALYRNFIPSQWTDLAKFTESNDKGIGPIISHRKEMARTLMKSVKRINLRWLGVTFCRDSLKGEKNKRAYDYMAQKTLESLIELIKHTPNLR